MLNKKLWEESRKNSVYLFLLLIFSLGTGILILLQAEIFSSVINSIFIEKKSQTEMGKPLLYFVALLFFRYFYGYGTDYYFKTSAERIKARIRSKIFHRILEQGPIPLKNQRTGELVTLLGEGMEWLTPYYGQYIPQLAQVAIIPILICGTVFFRDKISAVIFFATAPLIPLFMILIGSKAKDLNEKQWKKLSILSSHLLDSLQGFKTLLIFGKGKNQENKIYQVSENFRKSTMEVLRVSFLSALVLELAATISTAVIAVALGLRLVYGVINFRDGFFILLLAPEFYFPFRQLGVKFHVAMNGEAVAKRMEELFKDTKKTVMEEKERSMEEEAFQGGIEIKIKELTYRYEGTERNALVNVSFIVKPGEKIAIVGESGSGKSTLMNILMGFIEPQQGMIQVNGIDLKQINLNTLRSKIAYVPQKPHLFNGTIEENIKMRKEVVSMDAIEAAAKLANAHEFIQVFEKKYNTVVGEGEKIRLSGGEIQRIAIARAFLKNAPLVILDEPTSAQDAEQEEKIAFSLSELMKNKTVIQIAHRFNTIKKADKILVLQQGYCMEYGSHEELLMKKGMYYEMLKDMGEQA